MSIYLEITQLENGDIVLRETEDASEAEESSQSDSPAAARAHPSAIAAGEREPLVRISFSEEVKDMLGNELVGVAEAMIDAATDFLDGESITLENQSLAAPVIH